jgi:hypothetical protein
MTDMIPLMRDTFFLQIIVWIFLADFCEFGEQVCLLQQNCNGFL